MVEIIISSQASHRLNLSELWAYRELLFFFTWRDIKVKYKQTALGFLWVVLQPLLMALIFSAFFGRALNIPSDNVPYPVFVFSGLLVWNMFANGLTNAVNGMVAHANMIKKIYFPRLILPISATLVAGFDLCMAFLVFVGFLVYYQIIPEFSRLLWAMPAGLALTFLVTAGLGSLLGALSIQYRDFRYIVGFLVQVLMFMTPVLYPISLLKSDWQKIIIAMNPMTGAVCLVRSAFTNTALDALMIGISAFSGLLCFVVGIIIFRKNEATFADNA